MHRSLYALLLFCLTSMPCFGQSSLIGTYKLLSFTTEIDGQPPIEIMGKSPRGSLVLTPSRWLHVFTAENRKFGTSVEEKSAMWDSLSAYTGTYRLDGNKIVVSVDASGNERLNGTDVTRNWQLDGKRLSITTAPGPSARDPLKMAVSRVLWEKVE